MASPSTRLRYLSTRRSKALRSPPWARRTRSPSLSSKPPWPSMRSSCGAHIRIRRETHYRRARQRRPPGCRHRREADAKAAAAADAALDVDLGAVHHADGLDDRQADAGSAVIARTCIVHPEEAVEDMRKGARGDADAGIAHLEHTLIDVLPRSQRHAAAAWRVADGIVEQ